MNTAPRPIILVIDDIADNLMLVDELLQDRYTIKLANNGKTALRIALQTPQPDLILLDIMMPEMDGYEVCKQLKSNPATADIAVIFLTAKSSDDDEQKGFDLGAVDYIAKPINAPLLLARVKAQLSLKEARDLLERRSLEEKRRFEISLAQQMELSELRSTFVSMTSHEFRTPLTSILSSKDLLEHYADRLSEQDRKDTFDKIDSAVRRMITMLDQVLAIGRADANLLEFKPAPFNLAHFCQVLVNEAVATQTHTQHSTIDLHINLGEQDEHHEAFADEKLLRHILGNLLSNALKYSPNATLARFAVRRLGQTIEFEVSDQGIGIPEKDLPHLFGNFHRASNVGDIPGTGLGLAIVKRAVDTHGARIVVSSPPGQGTCFTVTLPIVKSPHHITP
jgi:two-component system sensor histidine kinase/response regulator